MKDNQTELALLLEKCESDFKNLCEDDRNVVRDLIMSTKDHAARSIWLFAFKLIVSV